MDFAAELKRHTSRIEHGLDRFVPRADARPTRLHTAMRYSLEAGGKRLRPVLVLAAAELFGAKPDHETALPAAIAIECVHTYSLIHDDLPCMDNDDLRRGRPTAHKQFDEATALLAGDALLTHAFALLSEHYPAPLAAQLVRELADAAGSRRLIGGQMEDLLAEKKGQATPDELEFIHLNKTAAMIEASLVLGGLVGDAPEPALAALRMMGRHLGLAFQIIDDILDATADTATLGKTAGKDAKAGKATYVTQRGLPAARAAAQDHSARASALLRSLRPEAHFLDLLLASMAARTK
ncbi:MAG: polyprenyl synthetase family protein [Opitutaceae bacterium]|nr:polyprenyl synthetase family protein [Opitutaceae bacterium]